ncbi:MAG: hypothetical protein WC880_00580 [Candidatus Paceibacterota bacterium]
MAHESKGRILADGRTLVTHRDGDRVQQFVKTRDGGMIPLPPRRNATTGHSESK